MYPSQKQQKRLLSTFNTCKRVYNELLALSKDAYKFGNVSLSKFDYSYYLKGRKEGVHILLLRDVANRVNKSYQHFFRRLKDHKCKKKGFPRYKSIVKSITYPQYPHKGFKFLNERRLKVNNIGSIPIIMHRNIKGKIKTLTIKRNNVDQWFAIFACEIDVGKITQLPTKKIGIDMGLENFATLSNGVVINNPRYLVKSKKKLKIQHRRLSRKRKGSKNRSKAKIKLARLYNKVKNQREDFLHKQSRILVNTYSFIGIESLNIQGLVKSSHVTKHIYDASWGKFLNMLQYKAVTGGATVVKDKPFSPSSQTCPMCDRRVPKKLSIRTHNCECGYVAHRDVASAKFILKSTAGLVGINACGDTTSISSSSDVSGVKEAGTKC